MPKVKDGFFARVEYLPKGAVVYDEIPIDVMVGRVAPLFAAMGHSPVAVNALAEDAVYRMLGVAR